MKKMPIYAREGVTHVWLADPETRTIEVFRLSRRGYGLVYTVGGDDAIRAEPFDAIEIAPQFVWGRRPVAPGSAKTVAKKKRAAAAKRPARQRTR
ncbi:MAG: Uma2 family endonuclease [Labilithrix sp.]|nr:Uma2 family endonuclease [Labilithrix sp.]MCW5810915.1 Uma2 family endonuclease [Labilithrix sp.]